MRVDSTQFPSQGGLTVKTGADTFVSSLQEGDNVKAEALSNERGAVIMKTDGGQTFRARLDPDVLLSAGDTVLLEMTGKEGGVITLSIRGETIAGDAAGRGLLTDGFEDKTLLAYAEKLAELNLPVTEETASKMRDIISLNPGMTLEEAAFLTSNGLTGDEALIHAALSVLSEGEKTDAMLERLMGLLLQPDEQGAGVRGQEPEDVGYVGRDVPVEQLAGGDAHIVPPQAAAANETGIAEWVALIKDGMTDAAKAYLQGETSPSPIAQEIIPQHDSVMQSTNLENNVEMMKNTISIDQMQWLETGGNHPVRFADTPPQRGMEPGDVMRGSETEGNHPVRFADTPPQRGMGQGDGGEVKTLNPELTGKAIAGLLSELKEFRGVSEPVLERFSDMLSRVAGDSAGTSGGDVGKLIGLLEKMFAKIEKNDPDAGVRLKSAKEELFARLMFLEEAISRAAPSAKTQMLDQTRRLMDHVRLLNNIDQFAYMQLPVQIGEQRKTAELYIFKKKNSKKLDPENINILLALDLENMGRWEGLINFRKKDVSIRMEVAGQKEKEHFSENTVLLHELLAEAGFKLVNTDITYSDVETTPLNALSALNRMTSGRSGGIDYMV